MNQDLEAAMASIEALEATCKKLKSDTFERLGAAIDAFLAAQESPESAACDVVRFLYWHPAEISMWWLAEFFGIGMGEIRRAAGPWVEEIVCPGCSYRRVVKSPSRQSRADRYSWMKCPECVRLKREGYALEDAAKKAKDDRKQARILELRAMPYRQYLQSPEWKETRSYRLRKAWYRCQVCNARGVTLDVHHRTYERRGCEADADLIVLCRPCHQTFHDQRRLADDGA